MSYTLPNGKMTLPVMGAAGTTGQLLTASGSNGTTWANATSNISSIGYGDSVLIAKNSPPELEVKGRMVINGRDLEERLDVIEKVLQIPERDVKLEADYPKLKQAYEDYITMLSKYRMWESIKGTKK